VDVIEPNFDDIRPCNVELKSYLQANYVCIAGTFSTRSSYCNHGYGGGSQQIN